MKMIRIGVLRVISFFISACTFVATSSEEGCLQDEVVPSMPELGASLLQHTAHRKPHEKHKGTLVANATRHAGKHEALSERASLMDVSTKHQQKEKVAETKAFKTNMRLTFRERVAARAREIIASATGFGATGFGSRTESLAQAARAKPKEKEKDKEDKQKKKSSGFGFTIPKYVYGTVFVAGMCGALLCMDGSMYPNDTQVSEDDPRHGKKHGS